MEDSAFEPFVSTRDVAEYLAKPVSWIQNNAGPLRMPRVKIGNHWRYRLSEIDKWMMKYQVGLQ